jgi:hypothetical protein
VLVGLAEDTREREAQIAGPALLRDDERGFLPQIDLIRIRDIRNPPDPPTDVRRRDAGPTLRRFLRQRADCLDVRFP